MVGFAHLVTVDGHLHLEEIDVHPDQQRQGIGAALVRHCIERSASQGRITLSTFRELSWNAPFYATLGFRELPESRWTDALRALRDHEAQLGLDVAARCLMEHRSAG